MAWHVAARSSDVGEGKVFGAQVQDLSIALYRIGGAVYATSDICTHEVALLSDGYVDGDCIECPLHQALFHIPTGAVRMPPATEPIQTYPAKEEAENIFIELSD